VPTALLESPLALSVAIIAALGAWSALLAQRGVALFHDGVRPLVPELLAGRMTRPALAATAFAMSTGFVVGFGLPLALASGFVMIYLVLLPADVIGLRSPKAWIALVGGGLWGVAVVLAMRAILELAEIAPVDFVAPLSALFMPVEYALVVVPPLAVGFMFGARHGVLAVAIVAAATVAVGANGGAVGPLGPVSVGFIVGMAALVGLALWRERGTISGPADGHAGSPEDRLDHLRRLRRNAPWLAVQGVIIALACNLRILAGSEADFAFLAQGKMTEAALADAMRAFAFLPLIATSATSTGVAQSVGGLLVYSVGYLAPSPWLAAVAGAVVVAGEIVVIGHTDGFLVRHPAIRESAEHVRGSLARVLEIALLAGSVVAGERLIPGGTGILLVISLCVLNEVAGLRVYRLAAGPLAAVGVGLIANVLAVLGLVPPSV
jgi:hypothetical protein